MAESIGRWRFKIESHNHPSAIEPASATAGVFSGGFLRDIFTMGARPVATLNSHPFGNLDGASSARTKFCQKAW